MSHRLTTSACGHLVRCGKYECDTLPHPMTPTRIRFVSPPTPHTPSPSAAALAPTKVRRSILLLVMMRLPFEVLPLHIAAGSLGGNGNRQERGIRVGKKDHHFRESAALLLSERRIVLSGSRHGHGQLERRAAPPGPRHGRRDVGSRFRSATREPSAGGARLGGTPGHRASSRRDGLSRLLESLATHSRRRGCLSSDISGARPKTLYCSQARLVGELAPWRGVSRVGPDQATSQFPATARVPSTACRHDASRRRHLEGIALGSGCRVGPASRQVAVAAGPLLP